MKRNYIKLKDIINFIFSKGNRNQNRRITNKNNRIMSKENKQLQEKVLVLTSQMNNLRDEIAGYLRELIHTEYCDEFNLEDGRVLFVSNEGEIYITDAYGEGDIALYSMNVSEVIDAFDEFNYTINQIEED